MIERKTAKLIRKIKKGNQQAFKQLYDLYADYSLRTAYAITNNTSDAADIVQETFIKVYRNIDSYDIEKPFKPWFYRILVNESNRFLKKKSKEAISIESEQLLDFLNQQVEEPIDNRDVTSALKQLDEKHRTALILKYLNGFTEKEIAEIFELNVNTVKSRLYQGRQRLKRMLGGVKDE
ncbi:RNA polymerase sigma factor [Oceanobacillus halophilus]|uniref:RNA polymerase sigma factor n=1 Tax=Oceanobacillus halophilus TaxID=930130 RepID=A0A495A300_9BACI|nr:RNA polymerase sigma factor [Oceanobacillus halophilus]RKQ33464.1 RNA polymerase sigma factor [Oceanobacillus halophilus]